MRMKINDTIITAINKGVNHYGNVSQLAKAMGVAHSTILFWLSGKTTNISGHLWTTKIRPVLAPFLTKAQLSEIGLGPMNNAFREDPALYNYMPQQQIQMIPVQQFAPQNIPQDQPIQSVPAAPAVPAAPPAPTQDIQPQIQIQKEIIYKKNEASVVPYASLEILDPALEPVANFVKSNSNGKAIFANEVCNGYFGIESDGVNCAGFPLGCLLLAAASDYPHNGDAVIARIRKNGDIVIRKYFRNENTITLSSLPGRNDEEISWNYIESRGMLLWIFPLVEATAQLRINKNSESEN